MAIQLGTLQIKKLLSFIFIFFHFFIEGGHILDWNNSSLVIPRELNSSRATAALDLECAGGLVKEQNSEFFFRVC